MIVFLTLLYVGLLVLLIKLHIIKPTLWWKLSPVAWILLLMIVLFFPLQWGAPAGPINVYQPVIEIVPNVSGEVIEVPAEGNRPLKKGDVLFRIDPEPYQAKVDQLEAGLKEAQQNAKMLPADLASADAALAAAEARLVEAKQQEQSLHTELDVAAATVARAAADLELSEANYARDATLAKSTPGAVSQQTLDIMLAKVKMNKAALASGSAKEEQAKLAYESRIGGVNTAVAKAEEDRKAAAAAKQKAEIALASTINGENTAVAQLRAQLAHAKYNLQQTTVDAPSDGYVIGMTLHPGQRVAALPLRGWMAFVDTEQTSIAVGIQQYALRHVEPGQKAEVTFKLYPGKTFSATVEKIAFITPEGQVSPTGHVALAPTAGHLPQPYGVILKLDDPNLEINDLPGGAAGNAAIYTGSGKATHIIRKVMLRMQSFTNYILPW